MYNNYSWFLLCGNILSQMKTRTQLKCVNFFVHLFSVIVFTMVHAMPLNCNKIKFILNDKVSNKPAFSWHQIQMQHALVSAKGGHRTANPFNKSHVYEDFTAMEIAYVDSTEFDRYDNTNTQYLNFFWDKSTKIKIYTAICKCTCCTLTTDCTNNANTYHGNKITTVFLPSLKHHSTASSPPKCHALSSKCIETLLDFV